MDTETRQRRTRNLLIGLGALGGLFAVTAFALYAYHFQHLDISTAPADWGPFGDFVGGVLNPIVGLLALIGLLWTIYQNQYELGMAREEMRRSSEALQKNNEIAEKQSRKDELYQVITIIDNEIKRLLSTQINITLGITLTTAGTLESLLDPSKISPSDASIDEARSLVVHLIDLDQYLDKYSVLTGDRTVQKYFSTRYFKVATALRELDLLENSVFISFFDGLGLPETATQNEEAEGPHDEPES